MATKNTKNSPAATQPSQAPSSTSTTIVHNNPPLKTLFFVGNSKEDLVNFPKGIRQSLGRDLTIVQAGGTPQNAKPISTVGSGVFEICQQDSTNWYRVFYVAKFPDGIYVLHSFTKQTNKTAKLDIDAGIAAYKAAQNNSNAAKLANATKSLSKNSPPAKPAKPKK